MPYAREIRCDDGTSIHVWAAHETVDDMVQMCVRRGIDATSLLAMARASSRRTELLAERLLLHAIYGHAVELQHTADGRPFVAEQVAAHLSITHTTGVVVMATNDDHPIGIDVEHIGARVLRVRRHFLNEREREFIDAADVEHNVTAWTAKEAMFKVADDPQATMQRLSLDPFDVSASGVTRIAGHYNDRTFDIVTRRLTYELVLAKAIVIA